MFYLRAVHVEFIFDIEEIERILHRVLSHRLFRIIPVLLLSHSLLSDGTVLVTENKVK
jgi:hypothetical protein